MTKETQVVFNMAKDFYSLDGVVQQQQSQETQKINNETNREKVQVEIPSLALQQACKYGNFDILRSLTEKDSTFINHLDHPKFGSTPLVKASKYGHIHIVKYLLEQLNVDIHKTSTKGVNAITAACEYGRLDIVKYFVEKYHIDINIPGDKHDMATPLIKACRRGHLDVVKYLVENCHADTNHRDKVGRNCLHWAIRKQNQYVVQYLIRHTEIYKSSHSKIKGEYLKLACETGSLETVNFLFQTTSHTGGVLCTNFELLEMAVIGNNTKVIDHLINDRGIKIDSQRFPLIGMTLFHTLCGRRNRSMKAALRLLKLGANIHGRSNYMFSPLCLACLTGKTLLVRRLCEAGADARANTASPGATSSTPLHFASNRQITKYLVEKQGADKNAQSPYGLTPFHEACHDGLLGKVKYLIETGEVDVNIPAKCNFFNISSRFKHPLSPGSTPLHYVCLAENHKIKDRLRIVKCLLDHGADPFARNRSGDTPIIIAWYYGLLEIVQLLIDVAGPNILHPPNPSTTNTVLKNTAFTTTLPENADIQQYNILVRPLVKSHPIIIHALSKDYLKRILRDIPDLLGRVTSSKTGNLPLHDACMYGTKNVDVVEYMIKKNPDGLCQKSIRGRLPFHEACGHRSASREVLLVLLQHHPTSCVLLESDNFGRLPIEIAILNGACSDVIYMLLNECPTSILELVD